MAPNLKALKKRTSAIRRGFFARANSLRSSWRQNSTKNEFNHFDETGDGVSESPLLKNADKTTRKSAWQGDGISAKKRGNKKKKNKKAGTTNNMKKEDVRTDLALNTADLALNTGLLTRTFSEETKTLETAKSSTASVSRKNYNFEQSRERRSAYESFTRNYGRPNGVFVHAEDNDEVETVLESFEQLKRDVEYNKPVEDDDNDVHVEADVENDEVETILGEYLPEKSKASAPTPSSQTKNFLPSFAISGSMLHREIDSQSLDGSSVPNPAANTRRVRSHDKSMTSTLSGSSGNVGIAQNHYTTSMIQSNNKASSLDPDKFPALTDYMKRAAQTSAYFSSNNDGSQDNESVPGAIRRTRSGESQASSVSSVTMYSSYQNDPLVRASNSLFSLLHNERKTQQRQKQQQSMLPNLYEA